MLKIKRDGAWHCVQLVSNSLTQFKSLSRTLARNWRDANQPLAAADVLNATAGKAVWRSR